MKPETLPTLRELLKHRSSHFVQTDLGLEKSVFAAALDDTIAELEKERITIRLERHDAIPAFGAFLRCEPPHDQSPVILLNVFAAMSPECDSDEGPIQVTREERKRAIITTIMHEVGHALESHFKLPVNEDAIEQACQDWESMLKE